MGAGRAVAGLAWRRCHPQAARRGVEFGAAQGADSRFSSYVAGVGVTLLNPLTIVGWIALGGGFFSRHPETQLLGGGLLALLAIIAGTMSHVVVLSAVLATGRRWLSPRVVQGVSAAAGAILLLIAASFLVSAVQGMVQGMPQPSAGS